MVHNLGAGQRQGVPYPIADNYIGGMESLPTEQLTHELIDHGILKAPAEWTQLAGGRSNRVWHLRTNNDLDLCVKLYPKDPWENPLFANDPLGEHTCLKALAPHGLSPTPVAFIETSVGPCLVYEHISGTILEDQVKLIAQCLAQLHQLPALDGLRDSSVGSGQLGEDGLHILGMCQTPTKMRLRNLMPDTYVTFVSQRRMIHADPVPANIIVSEGKAKLIDWQCPAFGDPAEDLCHFLSPAMQWLYCQSILPDVEVSSFISSYAKYSAAFDKSRFLDLRAWYSWRIAAYCLWQVEHGNSAYQRPLELEISALEKPHSKIA